MQEEKAANRCGDMGGQILVMLARRARAARILLGRESRNPFNFNEAQMALLEGQAKEALEAFKLAQALTSRSAKIRNGDWPRYLAEFPRFGLLDVELPEGFEDHSSCQDACPTFRLPNPGSPDAEFPLLTICIDFKDVAEREFKDEHRFRVSIGTGLNGVDFTSNEWSAILSYVALQLKQAQ